MITFFSKIAHREFIHLLVLGMLCGLFFFAPMDMRGLWEPDEARHAEIAREMVESGDWVTPHLNYVKYFEKPILAFWMIGVSFKLFGVSETSARLMPVASATLVVFVVYFIGRRLWNSSAGFWSGLCLATSVMFIGISQIILVDMPLCLGIVLALLGALQLRDNKNRGRYLFWGGSAIGFLSKGALGAGLPFLMVLVFIIIAKEWDLLKKLLRIRGILFFLIICAPWYILVSLRNPEFLSFFWNEHWQRLFTNTHSRWEPPWYYLPIIVGGFMPWIVLFPWAIAKIWPGWRDVRGPQQRGVLWVLVWFTIYFVFFSLSSSKMMHYVLPLMPAMALIVGWPLSRFMSFEAEERNGPYLRRSLGFLAIIFMIMGLGIAVASGYIREMVEFRNSLSGLIYPLLLLATALWLYLWRSRWWMVVVGPLVSLVIFMVFLGSAMAPFENWRSLKGVVQVMEMSLLPSDVLVSYGDTYYGINFYGQRRMAVVKNWGELEFGRQQAPDRNKWFLRNDEAMFNLLRSGQQRVVVICRLRHYPKLEEKMREEPGLKVFEWHRLDDKVIFSNQPR